MDDIQSRLQETSQNCLKAFAEWEGKKKDRKAQEDLHSAIHELRKVSSRLEIELALSERDQMKSKPLPIPSHRSNTKSNKVQIRNANEGSDSSDEASDADDNHGNTDQPRVSSGPRTEVKKRRTMRRPQQNESKGND